MASYDATILAESSVLAYYPLNETSGTTANDKTSNAYNGTLHGTITLNQTKLANGLDNCMLFDGGSGYIVLPNNVQVPEPLSYELWINSSNISANGIWLSESGLSGTESGWDVGASNQVFVAGHNGSYTSANSLVTSITYYIVVNIDTSNNYVLWVGKVGTDSAPSQWGTGNPGGGPTYTNPTQIGCRQNNPGQALYFKGNISSVAFYNNTLSQTQMNNHYTVGITTPTVTISGGTLGLMGVG
jgi:concanavalin A-like lectin/glucanase superfamily protein